MELLQAVRARVSVREYTERAIDRGILMTLVDAGRRAPSARAVEPWEFVVIAEDESLAALGQMTAPNGAFIQHAAAAIVVLCQDTKYYLEDGVAATENILLAAAGAGLGACWIAGDKKEYAASVARYLHAPHDVKLVSIIALGYPAQPPEQKKQRTLEKVVHWEKF